VKATSSANKVKGKRHAGCEQTDGENKKSGISGLVTRRGKKSKTPVGGQQKIGLTILYVTTKEEGGVAKRKVDYVKQNLQGKLI